MPSTSLPTTDLEQVLTQLWTDEIIFFPVRHHSPACAWHLNQLIYQENLCAVLIEGPESFTTLIPFILHKDTVPPFAVYTNYVPKSTSEDESTGRFAAYYPFCEYSPELVALQAGQTIGADLKFIDLNYPEQVQTEIQKVDDAHAPRVISLLEEHHLQHSAYLEALAHRTGCRDTNDLWDHLFEANYQSIPTSEFIRHVATYCYMARQSTPLEELHADGTETREQNMAALVSRELRRIKKEKHSGKILVVTGGFHTVVLPQLIQTTPKRPKRSKTVSGDTSEALIRYSFDQLDALNGYAAGMPSPQYYQLVWAHREQVPQQALQNIAREVLVEFGRMTREQKMQAALSTADEIAALQQAILLAEFRGHPGPLREDLLDGIRSCFVKGGMEAEGTLLLSLVQYILSGNQIGRVTSEAGTPPIIQDFQARTRALRLKIDESTPKNMVLDIYRHARHRQISRFFHTLQFLNIPFARFEAGPDFVKGIGLDRIQEYWSYCWTPQTESSLIDMAIYGSTVEEAALNVLQEHIATLAEEGKGRDATIAVSMLIQACRMGLQQHVRQLLRVIDEHIAEEPHFVSAVQAASQLLILWQAREPLEAHDLKEIPELLRAVYVRACYLVPALVHCPDEQVGGVLNGLNAIRELFAGDQHDFIDATLFWAAGRRVISQPECQPTVCGGITGLLYREGQVNDDELHTQVKGYIGGSGYSWEHKIGFLRGLLHTCREVAWQNRELMRAIDDLMNDWEDEKFLQALPEIRLAFADLTPRETDRVAEFVAGFYGEDDLGELIQRDISEATLHQCVNIEVLIRESLKDDNLEKLFG